MGILSDSQIRELIGIEPFEENVKRPGRISYGVSSYGYDLRVGSVFKIFTNVNSEIVDPKRFSERSFVTIDTAATGQDHVLIPPNSFALCETVETVTMPREYLAVCLGKSTYARCFSADTKVALVDGTSPTLEQMAHRAQKGEMFWGYSIGPFGRLIVSLLDAPRFIGRDGLLEVVLDDGATVHCTPDHNWLMRDGRMAQADSLRPGDSLMPLYRHLWRGYEMVYQPLNGHLHPTHRLADEWNVRNGIYQDEPGIHRHHVDLDRRNNRPWNIRRLPAAEHIRLHNELNFGPDFDSEEHSAAIREAFETLRQDPNWREHLSQVQQERATHFWHDEKYKAVRARVIEGRQNPTEATREAHRRAALQRYQQPGERERQSQLMTKAWANDDGRHRERQAEIARNIRLRGDITADVVRAALDQTGSVRGAAGFLGCDRSVFRRFPEVVQAFQGRRRPGRYRNHKVAAVKQLHGEHDVYCLTVPEAGNFALEAGVFVQNCGIIVNVTPIEPEWRGKITLEISNTTPLPAKIYANEGIAQLLFLKGEKVCAVSYADKSGKYQDQSGLTLPKVD